MPKTETQRAPVRIDPALLAGRGLDEIPPRPAMPAGTTGHVISERDGKSRVAGVFEGDIVSHVFESSPRKFQVVNHGFDEFIHILEGNLILTDGKGVVQEFGPGDHLVLAKGFNGTWEMTGDVFRELVVIETKSFEEEMKRLFE
jgi:uncharacterized cupin superfamily protein